MVFILKQLILSIKKDSYNMIHLKWRKLIYQSFGQKLLKNGRFGEQDGFERLDERWCRDTQPNDTQHSIML